MSTYANDERAQCSKRPSTLERRRPHSESVRLPKRTNRAVPLCSRGTTPDGFTIAPEPSTLDDSLVDRSALSTCAGRHTAGIVTSATPPPVSSRLVKKPRNSNEVQLPYHLGCDGTKLRVRPSCRSTTMAKWPWVTCSLPLVGRLDSSFRLPGTH